jgi:hypothetical protein
MINEGIFWNARRHSFLRGRAASTTHATSLPSLSCRRPRNLPDEPLFTSTADPARGQHITKIEQPINGLFVS